MINLLSRINFNLTKKQIGLLLGIFIFQTIFGVLIYNLLTKDKNIIQVSQIIQISLLPYIFVFLFLSMLAFWVIILCLYNKNLLNIKNVNLIKLSFYILMLFFVIIMVIIGYLTHGEYIRTMLHNNPNDVFMDFFNSIQYGMNPYSKGVIYPPLINVFYGFLGRFFVKDTLPIFFRDNQMGAMVFTFYILSVYWLLYFSLNKFTKTYLIKEFELKLLYCLMLLSLPFLFAMERGNSIILALIFSILFLVYYNKERTNNIIAYICLAIAVSIKIIPFVFSLILLRDRQWKDFILCSIIILLIFNIPFIATDGNLLILIENIVATTRAFQGSIVDPNGTNILVGYGVYVNIENTIKALGDILFFDLSDIAKLMKILLIIFSLYIVIMKKTLAQWKLYTLLCGILVLSPGFSAVYNLVYYVIPLICFLNSKPQNTCINFIYLSLFSLIFIPFINIPIPLFQEISATHIYPIRITTLVEGISIILLSIIVIIDELRISNK